MRYIFALIFVWTLSGNFSIGLQASSGTKPGDALSGSILSASGIHCNDDTLYFSTPWDSCHQAVPMCGDTSFVFHIPYVSYWSPLECCPGDVWPQCCRSYNCKGQINTTIMQRWFIMHIASSGMIMVKITKIHLYNNTPVIMHPDAFLYGPFDTPTGACLAGLVDSTVVDCAFYGSHPDTLVIPNAQSGEFYLLNITGAPYLYGSDFIFRLLHLGEPGYGTLDCNMMVYCTILSITAHTSVCNPQSNTFTLSGQVYFVHPPQTGNLVVWDVNTGYAVNIPGPFVSPVSYSIAGLPCDNGLHTVTAMFWDSASCNLSAQYQAPVLCPDAILSGSGGICEGSGGYVPLSVNINPNVQMPVTIQWKINGVSQPPVITNGPFPYIIQATTAGVYTLDTVYNALCAGNIQGQATVNIWPPPLPNLGPDLHLCEGREAELDAGAGYQSYQWNTGDNTRFLTVNKTGEYSVTVTDNHGCQGSDTIQVDFVHLPSPKPIKHN